MVGEAEAARFLRDGFGRDAWRAKLDPAKARALFDWAELNAALNTHRLAPPRLKLSGARPGHGAFGGRNSRSGAWRDELNVGALLAELKAGATLILDAAQELSPSLQRLCAALSAEFTCFVQTNLYACWGATQGFDVHWDDHDVFVVQVEGRKTWRLYGLTREAALTRGDPPSHKAPPEPREVVTLETGDLLYLPRGYWHAAVGVGEPSLHLTLGLTRRTGNDFLHWLADEAIIDARVRADLLFEQGDAALGETLRALLTELAGRNPAELARLYRRHVESVLPQRPQLGFPVIGAEAAVFRPGDRLSLAYGAARIEPGPTEADVVLSWRGVRFTLAAPLEPLLADWVEGGAIAFGDVAAAAGEGSATAFVREMIGRGVLVLSPDGDA